MSDIETTETKSMAGRKPEGNKATQVRLSPEMKQQIDEIAGKGRRAQWIRDALEVVLKLEPMFNRYRDKE